MRKKVYDWIFGFSLFSLFFAFRILVDFIVFRLSVQAS